MLNFLAWYLLVTLLGWLTFPLAWRLFPALPDRGFSLARPLGLLVWGYLFWMMASLGIVQNDGGGLLLALLVLAAVSGSGLLPRERREGLRDWLKSNRRTVVAVEVLFFLAFAFLTFVRAGNPDIHGTEKPMELAFINAILRSPSFPPHDPWLSGYAISYYYFGYVMAAMLAKATGTLGSVAFNLMIALVFALSAAGAYGILYNLLSLWQKQRASAGERRPSLGLPLLGPLFLLIVSNFEGFLEVLHRRGLFWKFGPDGQAVSAFWTWLDLKDLREPPLLPTGWMPERYLWWWRASRVVMDYDLAGGWREIIDEFPFFSYLLGDLHPHVLAMPFGLLALAAALNLFLGGWKGETDLRFFRLPLQPAGLLASALILGGLAFLNTWDILIGFGLLVGVYALGRALEQGWAWERLKEAFLLGLPLGLLSILLYLPFYAGFSSQAGGILPNLENPTRGAQLWVMFGPLFLVLLAYLAHLWRDEKRPAHWRFSLGLVGALVLSLWAFSWLLALLAQSRLPAIWTDHLASQGFVSTALYFSAATLRRLSYIGGLLTLLALLVPAIAFLVPTDPGAPAEEIGKPAKKTKKKEDAPIPGSRPAPDFSLLSFVLFLILLGGLLVLAPEFFYLRDQFGNRMNTIFKFYYQAWMLWSLAAAFGAAVMLRSLRGAREWVFRLGLALVLFMALVYPVLGLSTNTGGFQLKAFFQTYSAARLSGDPAPLRAAASVWTLDGGAFARPYFPDDMAAADWLRRAPAGVVVEATRADASYHYEFGLIATYSGQPNVLGWPGHEAQWRGTYDGLDQRINDIQRLYETRSWEEALSLLRQYDVRYVYVGSMERSIYRVNELKFQQNLAPVFQQGQAVIYEVPPE